jgi:hypothetical protein
VSEAELSSHSEQATTFGPWLFFFSNKVLLEHNHADIHVQQWLCYHNGTSSCNLLCGAQSQKPLLFLNEKFPLFYVNTSMAKGKFHR